MPSPSLTPLATAVLRVPGRPERILEVGCGEGDGVMFLAREFPAARVRGVDTSERAIRRAVARVGLDPEGRVAFKHGGRRALPYPNDHFDLVVQAHGRPLPARVARVLRPGGHFVYVERRGARRLPRPGPLRSALGRLFGFQTVEAGEAEGARFVVARLRDPA